MKQPAASVFGLILACAVSTSCGALLSPPGADGGRPDGGGVDAGAYKDDLRFGTGFDSKTFKLAGEGNSFPAGTVYFRFESATDFEGRFVRLYLNTLEQRDYSACKTGHICISSFTLTKPGTYEVKAFLVQTVIDIGKETLVTTASVTLN